jgi:flagellar biosynthesis anti-sigma factor FlgM
VTGRSEKSAKEEQPAAAAPQDQTSFSSDRTSLTSLEARAMQTPEIRHDRVAGLRDAIRTGQYALEPDKIAEAMLNELAR